MKEAPTRPQIWYVFDLGLPCLQNCKENNLLFLSNSVYSSLFQHLRSTTTRLLWQAVKASNSCHMLVYSGNEQGREVLALVIITPPREAREKKWINSKRFIILTGLEKVEQYCGWWVVSPWWQAEQTPQRGWQSSKHTSELEFLLELKSGEHNDLQGIFPRLDSHL